MEKTEKSIQIRYFSGYIRNWRSLCAELGISTSLSRQQREEEIIKNAYISWGMDFMSHIYGCFVIALWDDEEQTLYVIRDQVGQKHIFYAEAGGELICSGDISELANDSRIEKRINKRMLQLYLFYGYPIGSETFYDGIYKLMPGHYVKWDGKKAEVVRYWKPEFAPDHSKTVDQWAQEIREVVTQIFSEESGDSEFPYKESFLSGGVDSSYLLAAGDAVFANTVGYVGFEDSGFDESSLAQHTAEILGKGFRKRMIDAEEFFGRIPAVIEGLGQPLGDASAVAFSIGCSAVKEHTKVVYSGEGIDEFFGGYNAHKTPMQPDWKYYLTCSHIMSQDVIRSIMKDYDESIDVSDPVAAIWNETEGQDELDRKLTTDISLWLEGDIYLNTDRTSTACGVELHTPFSDLRLFNVARRIPAEMKFMNDQNKYAFRKAASSLLPDEVAFRKKVGFPVPVRKWLADERFNKPIISMLTGETAKTYFNTDELLSMWERFINGEELLWNRIYAIYAFLLWASASGGKLPPASRRSRLRGGRVSDFSVDRSRFIVLPKD